jgi:hypothetical protein
LGLDIDPDAEWPLSVATSIWLMHVHCEKPKIIRMSPATLSDKNTMVFYKIRKLGQDGTTVVYVPIALMK